MYTMRCFMGMLVLQIFIVSDFYGQARPFQGPNDPAGDPHSEREGYMNGNNIQLLFFNNTELSGYPRKDLHHWPKGRSSNVMTGGMALLVSARVYITNDSIPLTNRAEIESMAAIGLVDTLYFCQTNYREEMDRDAIGRIEWGFHPVGTYLNPTSNTPAISNDPNSWPPAGWPALGNTFKWPGEWNGRFGRGIIRADLETFFVVNDAQDQEYLQENQRVKYYPRPGIKIGDIDPDVTVQKGQPWGGSGIRVAQRGLQWDTRLLKDVIFWEYKISNISDYDLLDTVFGFWVDNDIGGENTGEDAAFNRDIGLVYSWDRDGFGENGFPTGTMGFSLLETPGLYTDFVDKDDDGLTDERRDNQAMIIVGPYDGITDLAQFLDYYNLDEKDLKEHWSADEDQDWQDGLDLNNNGIYDADENPGDDVGLDGIAPGEYHYVGPDADGTECNHKPDILENGAAEPNFGWLDVSETDMTGISTLHLFDMPPHSEPYSGWFRNDKSIWSTMSSNTIATEAMNIHCLMEIFASGVLPLAQSNTEHISMAVMHSFDPLTGLVSSEHSAPTLFNTKKIIQVVYDKDYRYPSYPQTPTLVAILENRFVTLTWDNNAETNSREPFLHNVNDFEGYKLYRYTRNTLFDTDLTPIFQCDLIDGKKGTVNYGTGDYYLGDDSGITHSYIDDSIQQGLTYYYAIVAYDYGIHPDSNTVFKNIGIPPLENPVEINQDRSGNIVSTSKNVAYVTVAPVPGLETPYEMDTSHVLGSGTVVPEAVSKNELKANHTYKVKFSYYPIKEIHNYDRGALFTTDGLSVYDITEGHNTLVYQDIVEYDEMGVARISNPYTILIYNNDIEGWHISSPSEVVTGIFDGLRLKIQMPVITAEFDSINSGWLQGSSPVRLTPSIEESKYFPWDYRIVFTDNDSAYIGSSKRIYIANDEYGNRIPQNEILTNVPLSFYVQNQCFIDSSSGDFERLDIIAHDHNKDGRFNILKDRIFVGPLNSFERWAGTIFVMDFLSLVREQELPESGDIYRITFQRPFWKTDSLTFKIDTHNVNVKESVDDKPVLVFKLFDNFPNPFNSSTTICYSISKQQKVNLTVYNILGQRVSTLVNKIQDAGIYKINFSTNELPSGVYLYKTTAGDFNNTKKLTILK